MTRIGLEGMEFFAFHGYYKAEQKIGNKYVLDVFVNLKTDLKDTEEIEDTFNYEYIFDICKEEMNIPRKLLETVAYKIVAKLKSKSALIKSVDLKLRKIGVQLGGKLDCSTIEYKA